MSHQQVQRYPERMISGEVVAAKTDILNRWTGAILRSSETADTIAAAGGLRGDQPTHYAPCPLITDLPKAPHA
ncbi:hypothetical protein UFOVP1122_32 [uncultured Caudovirales phage]|uniref:Uncharacterized protein n=1 Tax=uncultured Caudovirales phage TaxID=2100421 RepID=A0A6J5QJI8_9CAUD|nr:hypothetical protein UFOVP1122_32 [uncultured Caudovirales phage]